MRTNRRKERMERMIKLEHNKDIVSTGICPDCGSPLYRNNALAGWWQCEGYPCIQMRHKGFEDIPKCSFQIFTE